MKRIISLNWFHSAADWARILSDYMSAREKTMLVVLSIVLLISGTMSVMGFIERNSHLVPQSGGSYVEAAVGQPRHINPILAGANDLDLDITNLVYSSLFQLNSNFELTPDLASGYTISDNQLEYTITLRNDVVWHDGTPFTADDVIFTIRSIQTSDYGSPLETSFQGVSVEKIDDYTVVFKLGQPYAPFLTNLTVGIAPKHVWESIPPKNAALAEQMLKPVGTGPFKFAEIITRRKTGEVTNFRLVRNEQYYGQHPYLDEFTFLFFPTHEEAVRALLANKADGVGFLPLSLAGDVTSRASLEVRKLLLPQYFGLFLNEVKNELLSDAGIRSALALAVDREIIVEEALQGNAVPLHVPIPNGQFDFGDTFGEPKFDPEVAKQNLDEANWKDTNGDGVREKDGKELRVTITTTDWPEYVRTAELIKEQWEAIGVGVEVQSYGAGIIQQTVVGPRDYQILLYGEILASDPDPYPFWHSTQTRSPGLNLALFKDEQVDKLLEEARKTTNRDERKQKYIEFQQRFLDLNPAIVLYQPYYLFAQSDDVRGLTMERVSLPVGRFNEVENWHVNVKRVWNN